MPGRHLVDVVVGARPNFVKVASLLSEMARSDTLRARLVHTGQHDRPELSGVFFAELGLPAPDIHLRAGGGSPAEQTGRVMVTYEAALAEHAPAATVVVGDVNSTLGAAISAKRAGVALVHLEAGLRSRDRSMPEEINRLAVDAVTDRFWCPSADAADNLRAEGHAEADMATVGNFMVDALMRGLERFTQSPPDGVPGRYALATVHRPANTRDPARRCAILSALRELSGEIPVVLVDHPSLLREMEAGEADGLRRLPPQPYSDFLALQRHAAVVVTDSGGVQEETTVLGVPCLTVRPNTERPVTLDAGTNRLVEPENIVAETRRALTGVPADRPSIPGWDGRAAERAVRDLEGWLEAGCPVARGGPAC